MEYSHDSQMRTIFAGIFIIFLVKMVPPAKRKLVYSSDSEDERRSHPLGPRRAMIGRGSGLSPCTSFCVVKFITY